MKKAKLNIYRSVLLIVDGMVIPEKGKAVNATPLFAEYVRHAERWGVQISKAEFCDVLDKKYARRYGRFGVEYEDLKLV